MLDIKSLLKIRLIIADTKKKKKISVGYSLLSLVEKKQVKRKYIGHLKPVKNYAHLSR